MENIIYFYEYRGNEKQNIVLEKVHFTGQQEDYCLIKIGIAPGFWSEDSREASEAKPPLGEGKEGKSPRGAEEMTIGVSKGISTRVSKRIATGVSKRISMGMFQEISRRVMGGITGRICLRESFRQKCPTLIQKEAQTLWSRQSEKRDFPRANQVAKEQKQVERLYELVRTVLEDGSSREEYQMVFENNVRPQLTAFPDFSNYFPWEEFRNYRDLFWVEQIMPYAVHADYQIVGYAPCIPRLLVRHARRIRSVCWILSKAVYTGQVQEFVEDYYEEYGLAITVHLCEPGEPLRKSPLTSDKPINILDFSGEERMSCVSIFPGSVWLDMDAMEQKARRIAIQKPEISYISLHKRWKSATNTTENPTNHLDTACKSRYNT